MGTSTVLQKLYILNKGKSSVKNPSFRVVMDSSGVTYYFTDSTGKVLTFTPAAQYGAIYVYFVQYNGIINPDDYGEVFIMQDTVLQESKADTNAVPDKLLCDIAVSNTKTFPTHLIQATTNIPSIPVRAGELISLTAPRKPYDEHLGSASKSTSYATLVHTAPSQKTPTKLSQAFGSQLTLIGSGQNLFLMGTKGAVNAQSAYFLDYRTQSFIQMTLPADDVTVIKPSLQDNGLWEQLPNGTINVYRRTDTGFHVLNVDPISLLVS